MAMAAAISGERIYLDHNASAPLVEAARVAMAEALVLSGNASSVHAEGRRARSMIEKARSAVASLAGVKAPVVTFTSGGTEAANLALRPDHFAHGGKPLLLIGASEHACIRDGHGFEQRDTRLLPVDANGRLDLEVLQREIATASDRTVVLALQAANNETGVIQPVAQAAQLVHAAGGFLVCDAVQAAGREDCAALAQSAGMLILSAHKIGGPQGAGALVCANGRLNPGASPLIRGGGQEKGVRGGTENTAAIAGFGAAAEHANALRQDEQSRLRALRDAFEAALLGEFPDAVIFARTAPRLANTSAFAIPGAAAETVLIGMDLEGFALSSGSACSSGKVKPSHVLDAMGIDPRLSLCALRASFGAANRDGDEIKAVEALKKVVARINRAPARAA